MLILQSIVNVKNKWLTIIHPLGLQKISEPNMAHFKKPHRNAIMGELVRIA